MDINDLLKNKTIFKIGCQVHSITAGKPKNKDLKVCTRLKKKPGKITAYFRKDMIAEVYKGSPGRADSEFYVIKTTDNTVFQVAY